MIKGIFWDYYVKKAVNGSDNTKGQNHIDTEKLVSSLRKACHQAGGKNNRSPASSVTHMASGTTRFAKDGYLSSEASEKTSI